MEGWWISLARAARARAHGTRAHVRNIPSSVLPKSTVRSCTGCISNRPFKITCLNRIPVLDFEIDLKLEPWLRRYSGKRVPQIYISISHSLLFRTVMQSTFFERAYDSFQDYIRISIFSYWPPITYQVGDQICKCLDLMILYIWIPWSIDCKTDPN